MEKTLKILGFLPKAVSSAVTFKTQPVSPVTGKSFPAGSTIKNNVGRRIKNRSFNTREPVSPIVSCVGQVKGRSKKPTGRKLTRYQSKADPGKETVPRVKKGRSRLIMKVLFKKRCGNSDEDLDETRRSYLGHWKEFSSERGRLENFDWRVHGHGAVVPEEIVLKPRNEINLWKRRTMGPPSRLKL